MMSLASLFALVVLVVGETQAVLAEAEERGLNANPGLRRKKIHIASDRVPRTEFIAQLFEERTLFVVEALHDEDMIASMSLSMSMSMSYPPVKGGKGIKGGQGAKPTVQPSEPSTTTTAPSFLEVTSAPSTVPETETPEPTRAQTEEPSSAPSLSISNPPSFSLATEPPVTSPPTRATGMPSALPTSSDVCLNAQQSIDQCFGGTSSSTFTECNECVSNAIPVDAVTCSDFESPICTAIVDDCTACADCRELVQTYLNCALEDKVGCTLACDIPTMDAAGIGDPVVSLMSSSTSQTVEAAAAGILSVVEGIRAGLGLDG